MARGEACQGQGSTNRWHQGIPHPLNRIHRGILQYTPSRAPSKESSPRCVWIPLKASFREWIAFLQITCKSGKQHGNSTKLRGNSGNHVVIPEFHVVILENHVVISQLGGGSQNYIRNFRWTKLDGNSHSDIIPLRIC